MKEIQRFLKKDLKDLTESEKLELFEILQPAIRFAIKKALSKFYKVPLEFQDMMTYAWFAFDDLLKKYQTKNIKKKFISSVIDAVTWKCTDACVKFINNKHKVLNISVYHSPTKREDEINKIASNYFPINTGWNDVVEKYFKNCDEPLAREIFSIY
ncbi:sigma-70 family RNA polymerase sigma factor [Mycoplasma putrefaciens]|uniref:sigma-70 family RNA polymerase sigma factor n=1 Tax=Mycoplasma putrefaciens TaxID=2123 RepID=UPI00039FE3C4|nr:sigma-70 family RNA polymerase sigma factor [Mycoplasma putrefaciens]